MPPLPPCCRGCRAETCPTRLLPASRKIPPARQLLPLHRCSWTPGSVAAPPPGWEQELSRRPGARTPGSTLLPPRSGSRSPAPIQEPGCLGSSFSPCPPRPRRPEFLSASPGLGLLGSSPLVLGREQEEQRGTQASGALHGGSASTQENWVGAVPFLGARMPGFNSPAPQYAQI